MPASHAAHSGHPSTSPTTRRQRLESLLTRLRAAVRPEDVFGTPGDADELWPAVRAAYRDLMRRAHPDRFEGDPDLVALATEVSALANQWIDEAERRIARGHYGQAGSPWRSVPDAEGERITVRGRSWRVLGAFEGGDVCDVYVVREEGGRTLAPPHVLKVVRSQADNDLLDAERRALRRLHAQPPDLARHFSKYLPRLVEPLALADGRRANVLSLAEGHYSLAEVIRAHPDGVDSRTLGWMFNRILEVLAYAHRAGVVHGAVLPEHVLVHPVTHGAVLVDWCAAVLAHDGTRHRHRGPEHVSFVSASYRRWYPPEVFDRAPASPAIDLYMAGALMSAVAGGAPRRRHVPDDLPEPIAALLRACLIRDSDARFDDAFALYERWQDALLRSHGVPRYHPFEMPAPEPGGAFT